MNDDELLARLRAELEPEVPPLDPGRLAAVAAHASGAAPGAPEATALRSRRSVLGMAAAALTGVAAGAGGVVAFGDRDDADAPVPPMETAAVRTAPGVEATARMIDHTWGLEVLLDVIGLSPGTRYEMTFVATDGRRVPAGGFIGIDGRMRCRNNGALLRADTARFVVNDPDGAELVSSELA